MKLSALAGEAFTVDPEITGLTADSRAVERGFLFAALPGAQMDGATFIPQAEENGAAAILARKGVTTRLPLVADDNPRARLAQLAARFHPRQPECVAAITGTNGKTSTAIFAEQLWTQLGRCAGSIGTLGARAPGVDIDVGLTTPEPVTLHRALDAMAGAGVDRLAMEASSHALAQSRADGVRIDIAAFTNITQDHLDYHADFDAYFAAKARLFSALAADNAVAVINSDGAGADAMMDVARARSLRMLTTGARGESVRLLHAAPTAKGLNLDIDAFGARYSVSLPLIGVFQAENALLAMAIVVASGADAGDVAPLLATLSGAPGRMERAVSLHGAGVYVDYAHTPDAVAAALRAIRPHTPGRILAIIGAGGDRDAAKRPLMGAAAAAHAEHVIVTDDNPRTEDPAKIRDAVMQGCPDADNIGDRADAIARGVAMLKEGDMLLILGKGHETGQQVGGVIAPFDDAQAARAAARACGDAIGRQE